MRQLLGFFAVCTVCVQLCVATGDLWFVPALSMVLLSALLLEDRRVTIGACVGFGLGVIFSALVIWLDWFRSEYPGGVDVLKSMAWGAGIYGTISSAATAAIVTLKYGNRSGIWVLLMLTVELLVLVNRFKNLAQ